VSVELILVRHAIAFPRNPIRWPDDRLRPLTPRGKQKFRKAAAGLAKWLPEVDHVLTSSLVRARETANVLTEHAHWPKALDCPQLAPASDPDALLAVLRKQKGQRIALVGHEPDLSTLVSVCLPGAAGAGALEMRKGGVTCIFFETQPSAGMGALTAFLPPRALRAMR
jgi:phosphohistidine phosphatase